MREYKFRGMDANGIMRYGRLSQDQENSTRYYKEYSQRICWNVGTAQHNIPVSNKTLGQYITIDDKNCVEIYKGDIIRFEDMFSTFSNYITKFDIINGVRFVDSNGYCVMPISPINQPQTKIEVIGNIHENP